MPNGAFQGISEELERVQKPLLDIDELLNNFALKYDIKIEKNFHDWPCRILRFIDKQNNDIIKTIQISLKEANNLTYLITYYITKDINNKRYLL